MAHETAPAAADMARILAWLDGWWDTEEETLAGRSAAAIIRALETERDVARTQRDEMMLACAEGPMKLHAEIARLREALERVREAVRMECLISEDLLEVDAWVGYAAMRAAAARIGAALGPPDPPDGGVE